MNLASVVLEKNIKNAVELYKKLKTMGKMKQQFMVQQMKINMVK